MKKVLSVLLVLALCAPAAFASGEAPDFGGATLNVYNWGEYIDEDLLGEFEELYNCRVNYRNFESNEMLYTNIISDDPWDILVPSDYMIERLIREKRLQPLDKSIVTNLEDLSDSVKNLAFDPDNTYSVPYLWQSVCIVYDKTKIDPALVEEKGWDIFLDPSLKGHAYMYDSSRDAFMVALKALGYSANTTDDAEIEAAYNWLLEMNSSLDPDYVTDEMIDGMKYGFKWISLGYSGDVAAIMAENENLAVCLPKQGTNIAVDAMVIPKSAGNPELANYFIRFVSEYESSLAISAFTGYASPNTKVLAELSGPGGEYEGNDAYLPREGYALDEVFVDDVELSSKLSDLWMKVMASK